MRWLRVAAATAALAGLCPLASAQTTLDLAVDVHPQRAHFGPDTPLELVVQVENRSRERLEDLRVTIAIYERARSRSGLLAVFEGDLPRSPLEALTEPIDGLAAGAVERLTVRRTLEELEAFRGAPEGVYPVAVTVRRSTGPALATAVTGLPLVAEDVRTPLGVLPVLDVSPEPFLRPDGTPGEDAAVRLRGLSQRLAALPDGLPAGISLSPLLLDQLALLTGPEGGPALDPPATEALAAVRDLATRGELLTVPYSRTRLPDLRVMDGTTLPDQLERTRSGLRDHLDAAPVRMAYPPALALDDRTLDSLEGAGVTAVLVPGLQIASTPVTPATPVISGDLLLVPADVGLAEAVREAGTGLEAGRALAELAMVYFESPGRSRVVALPLPATGRRTAEILQRVVDAPWAAPVAPSDVLSRTARRRAVAFEDVEPPPDAYRAALRQARRAVDRLAAYTLPGNTVVDRLRLATAIGLGTARWAGDWSDGRSWAAAVEEAAQRQQRLVSVAGGAITFTSQRGEVPVTVVNRATYPIRVRLSLDSAKLTFPRGDSRVLESLRPPGETVTVPALASSSGTFPLHVTLTSPDGSVLVASEQLVVRSTALNLLAVGLTAAAALFLVVWYGRRLVRPGTARRR